MKEVIERLVKDSPIYLSILVDRKEGLPVLSSQEGEVDIEKVSAYFASAVDEIIKATQCCETGDTVEEVLVTTSNNYVILNPIGERFVLVSILERGENLGIASLMSKRCASKLLGRLEERW
ncbi:MAG TPA: hypothetical protein ENF65_01470 [Euryarchaeota archaeon]|nr:MAG: hypothetical protein DRN46_05695 [Thermococci archaeon]RLF96740.1 MAG: hypothetical protein DRN52_01885 [Thermococci archaeon]HDI10396.1 hypothetical protein [Euryarchaeota archaeon]